MQSQRWAWTHTYAVPLFVTSLVALLLVGAGWTAVLVATRPADDPTGPAATDGPGGGPATGGPDDTRSPGSSDPGGTDPGTTPAGGDGPDGCVVGHWQLVEHSEQFEAVGGSFSLAGEGPLVEYRDDGTGTTDYRDGTAFEIEVGLGEAFPAEVTGRVDYRYEAADGTMRYYDMESEAELALELFGSPYRDEFSYSGAPFRYECEGDVLIFSNPERNYSARLERR